MTALYPHIEPFDTGYLNVGDGHAIYWEVCGNPSGKPALVLHGGPGSGCSPTARRYFDPGIYRIVLFDQRGSGRSRPHAGEPEVELGANTTHHLISDIELLRSRLEIERWLLLGGSWGSTLALAYAEKYPESVSELILNSIATTTTREIEWITRGVGIFFPAAWERFKNGASQVRHEQDLVNAYHSLLMSPVAAVREKAAQDWCDWEMAVIDTHPRHKPNPRYENPLFRLGFARLVTHYWRHKGWLEDGVLLRDAKRLHNIPGVLIHGRLDIGGPLVTPWQLKKHWPGSELVVVGTAGHDARDPGMGESIVAATDRFARP